MKKDSYSHLILFSVFLGMVVGCILTANLLPYMEQSMALYENFSEDYTTTKESIEILWNVGRQRLGEWVILFLILMTPYAFPGYCIYVGYLMTCVTSLFCVGIAELGIRGIFAFLCLEMPQIFFYALSYYYISKLFVRSFGKWSRFQKQLIPVSFVCYLLGILCEVYLNPTLLSWITIY